MLEIVNSISAVVKSKELKDYRNESVENFAGIFTGDIFAPVKQMIATGQFVLSIPDILFWDKMQRFLLGAYSDFEHQLKLCSRFDTDEKYKDFTKRQIHIIDELNDDRKVDYFANLTQSVLLEMIDIPLYFKCANILTSATREELEYLSKNIKMKDFPNNIFVNALLQYGLVTQTVISGGDASGNDGNRYDFAMLAHCIDRFSVDFRNEEKYIYNSDIMTLDGLNTDGLHGTKVQMQWEELE